MWLAASLWIRTKERTEVLAVLKEGAAHSWGDREWWRKLPEFEDVLDDPEFLSVTGTAKDLQGRLT
jgi:hypothetical protein